MDSRGWTREECRGWTRDESRCLMSIWTEESVQKKLKDSYRNRAIYMEISLKMKDNGFNRSWQQCQRKIKHLKHSYRKAKCYNSKSGMDRVSCPFYDELDKLLGDRPSLSPGEGDMLDSEFDWTVPLCNSTIEDMTDGAATPRTTTSDDEGHGGDASGPLSSSPAPSSSPKRQFPSTSGKTRRKKMSKFEATLEAFTAAMNRDREQDNDVLLQLQKAQHAHEEKLFGMMMQTVASLSTQIASAQRPPGPTPSYLWYQPTRNQKRARSYSM